MKKAFDDELSVVILHNDEQLKGIQRDVKKIDSDIEKNICQSEEILKELGYELPSSKIHKNTPKLNNV